MPEAARRSQMGDLYGRAVTRVPPSEAAPVRETACAVCKRSHPRPVFAVAGLEPRLVVCANCGLGWLEPMPSESEVASYYPEDYYGEPGEKFERLIEGLVRLVGTRHIRFLSAELAAGARVLDVGCGRGVLLAELADLGFEVHGVELNEDAIRGADPRARIRVADDLSAAGYPADFFDQVIIWHVFEHLREPRAVLAEVRRILRPGGRLIVAVPNFASLQARWAGPDWFHLDLPRHLYHFPLAALRRLVEEEGLRCESDHHFSLRQNPFGWVQSALNRWSRLPRNSLYILLHRAGRGASPPFDAPTRWILRLVWLVAMPVALGLLLVETALRSGATVHVVARRPEGERA